MKLINLEYLKSLKPCEDSLNNAIKYYSKFEGDILDVLYLDNISSEDKIWIASKVLPDNILHRFSIECAYSTLNNFEKEFPNDSRPRKAIEAKQAWLNNEISDEELREARLAASRSAISASRSALFSAHSAAHSAARSAAYSAAYSAHSEPNSAANSAEYSARSAARSAAIFTSRSAYLKHYKLLINKLINLIEIDIILGEL